GALLTYLSLADVMAAFPPGTDFSAPPSGPVVQGQANVPSNQFAFTVRLRVRDDDDPSCLTTPPALPCNLGEDRKVFFVHHDPTKHKGWPIAIDANGDGLIDGGGEPPPHMVDLDGDNVMELVQATAAGRVYAFRHDGTLAPGFPVRIDPAFSAVPLRTKTNHLKTGILGSPVLADLDGDGFLDIVVAAMDQHVYAWDRHGNLLPGWPVKIQDPAP